jgi:hypothetical protein
MSKREAFCRRPDLFLGRAFGGRAVRAVARTIVGVAYYFDTDLMTGAKVAGGLGHCDFIGGFLGNVAHAWLAVTSH